MARPVVFTILAAVLFVLVACLVNVAGDLILVAGLHLDAV